MKENQARGIILILVLISIPIFGPRLMRMAVIPGPEGLNLKVYGIQFGSYSNTLWRLGEISNNEILECGTYHQSFWAPGTFGGTVTSDVEIRCSFPDPYNSQFRKEIHTETHVWPITAGADYYTTLQIERRRPEVWEVNTHGDPLGTSGYPSQVRYIEYHTPQITEGNQISFTKYCIHVVPADYVVQMSVRGDRWFGWEDAHLWFMLQTNVWRTAFTENEVSQIQEWLDKSPPENATLSAYDYRGGFPIWGWIGEWDPLTWYDEEEREDQPPQEALDNVRISPSLEGREVTLYTDPSYQYSLDLEAQGNVADPEILQEILIGKIAALPDPDFATTVYTPLYLEQFYPYYEEKTWWEGGGCEMWYPTTYMRVRLMSAIYGEFNYLWTQQEADDQGYEWETRYSTYKYEEGPWEWLAGLGAFIVSPAGILSMLLFLGVIVLIVIVMINPAWILAIFSLGKKGGRKR